MLKVDHLSVRDSEEVMALLEFALEDIEPIVDFHHDVVFTVTDNAPCYSGRAHAGYNHMLRNCTHSQKKGARNWIELNIGQEKNFPSDNMRTKRVRTNITPWFLGGEKAYSGEAWTYTHKGKTFNFGAGRGNTLIDEELKVEYNHVFRAGEFLKYYRVYEVKWIRRPYGGVSSPYQQYNTWQEAFVATAAHEAQHIIQFRNKATTSEIECERVGDLALRRYRRLIGLPEYTPTEAAWHNNDKNKRRMQRKLRAANTPQWQRDAAKNI